MKTRLHHIVLLFTPLLLLSSFAFSQIPTIKSLDKIKGANNELLTITGTNFGDNKSNLAAYFGAMKGKVTFASDQVIEVRVPAGATFGNVTVTNTHSKLSGASNEPFMLSYHGESGLQISELEGQKDFDTEAGFYGLLDLCSCDFDGDLKTDVVGTTDKKTTIYLFANTTASPGLANISFNKIPINLDAFSLHATCGDLNGDGKPDLIITEANTDGERLFIFENASSGPGSIQFNRSVISLPNKKVKRVEIADVDGNGKPDLVVTSLNSRTVSIIPNTSTNGTTLFSVENALHLEIPLNPEEPADAPRTDAISIADLNGDYKPEIITSRYQSGKCNLYIFQNKSNPGNLSFSESKIWKLSGNSVTMKVADLNQDNKPEIVLTMFLASSVAIFKNTSTEAEISFDEAIAIETEERPVGLDLGDLDGNGKVDIVVASLTKRSLTILVNTGTPGNISFTKLIKSTAYINRYVNVGDIDGDGKPDITFTSVDDGGRNISSSKISIFRNKHCLIPQLLPEGPHQICSGKTIELSTTPSLGLSYEWRREEITQEETEIASFTASVTGNYSVKTTSSVDNCVHTSNEVSVTVEATPPLTGSPAILAVEPVCVGATLTLKAANIGASSYRWSGPGGYEATGLTADPPVSNFKRSNSGRYTLEVLAGTCVSEDTSIVVEVVDAPSFKLNADEINIVCDSQTKTLTVTPQREGFSFQWYEITLGAIDGETGTTLVVTNNGSYYAKATSANACASGETPVSKFIFADFPNASFDAPETGCPGQEITFTNLSTGNEGLDLAYSWNFGDGEESHEENPVHAYQNASSYTVKLKVKYQKGSCQKDATKTIVVDASPEVEIKTETGSTNICPGETLTLLVDGAFDAYTWGGGEHTSEIVAESPGVYSVTVATSAGCGGSGAIEIGQFPEPVVTIEAAQTEIIEGESVQLTASGLQNYLWSPEEDFDFLEGPTTNATPKASTVYTVTGQDLNGCTGEAQIEILVKGDLASKKIIPAKFFSPDNGDDINKYWTIEKILNYPRCGVTIFDDKGVTVYQAKPYMNDWDGTFNGRALPDGVYFYIIKCDGEENSPKTGSITIIR